MYEVRLSDKARRVIHHADKALVKKLSRCFSQLESDPPRHHNIRPLTGPLTGEWRIIYCIDDDAKRVEVTEIVTRQGAY